jgi:hypothetical protein
MVNYGVECKKEGKDKSPVEPFQNKKRYQSILVEH